MNDRDRHMIISEEYADFVVEYDNKLSFFERYQNSTYNLINEKYAVLHIPVTNFNNNAIQEFGYPYIPKCFGLTAFVNGNAEGVSAHNVYSGENTGNGVLIGIVDSGIDYRNPLFIMEDRTTKIELLWDQTIDSPRYPEGFYYGSEYTSEDINMALQAENPLTVVPSTDIIGEGTAMAGVATGLSNNMAGSIGVVPGAGLAIVKLKTAKKYLKDFYGIPNEAVCYQQNDIMMGIEYLIRNATKLGKPVVICIGLSSSQSSHKGEDILCNYLNENANQVGICMLMASGNEGDQGHHYYKNLQADNPTDTVYLQVGKRDKNFTAEMWGFLPSLLNVKIIAPDGTNIHEIHADFSPQQNINVIYQETVIFIDRYNSETYSEQQLIMFRFRNMIEGIWRFIVSGTNNLQSEFHIWLPIRNFITDETFFYNSNPFTTISGPGNAEFPITINTFEPVTITLASFTGKGFTTTGLPKPSITAPGINLLAPTIFNSIEPISGSSMSIAYTAGICAGIIGESLDRKAETIINTAAVKNTLLINATRQKNILYPNPEWGYGYIQ